MIKWILSGVVVLAAFSLQAAPVLRNGWWGGSLERKDGQAIRFNFEVKDSAGKKVIYLRNAGERILVDDVVLQGDSVIIHMPFYESQLRAVINSKGNLEGVWLRHLVSDYQAVPFRAVYGNKERFLRNADARVLSLGARYAATFCSPSGKDTTLRVGEFSQSGAKVVGTFLDAGGDLRYLEGLVDGDTLRLSAFDGTHAYYFTARIAGDSLTDGVFYAGPTSREIWSARKDAGAKLQDQYAMTHWNKDAAFGFTFKDLNGQAVSLSDARFKGKVVLVQIMGSWCPNCMDETRFLSGFYDQYHSKGVEVVALAYERSTDFERSQASVRSFQKRFDVKYPMLITGVAVGDAQRTEKTLPQLEKIVNFPTTIFVDKEGKIEKIHTGFSGPGTGEHYEEQKKEIYSTVDALLAK